MAGKLGKVYANKNKFKKAETHPDFRGKGTVAGVEVEFGMWATKDRDGELSYKLMFDEPYRKPETTDDIAF